MPITVYRRFVMNVKKFVSPTRAEPPYCHVCQVGDPVLRTECVPIPEEDYCAPHIKMIIKQMKWVMKNYKTVGISAPQIGVPLRIMAIHIPESSQTGQQEGKNEALQIEATPLQVILNPTVSVNSYERTLLPEGCASVRGYSAVVPRYAAVTLKGISESGTPCTLPATGFLSRVIQHEMDHLNGKLYVDVMDQKTFQNDGWNKINVHNGYVYMDYMPEK